VIAWAYSGNRLHPTQKPLPALLPLVKAFSAPGGLVLDPFAGSGSSLLAAKQLGRDWLGIELDAGHHATARARLAGKADPPA
jgi:adenine-specific DNA-methyltransferase